jgi:hypothetical protein
MLMHRDVGRKVRMQVGLKGGVEPKDKVALQISRIVKLGCRGEDEMKL